MTISNCSYRSIEDVGEPSRVICFIHFCKSGPGLNLIGRLQVGDAKSWKNTVAACRSGACRGFLPFHSIVVDSLSVAIQGVFVVKFIATSFILKAALGLQS